MHQRQPEITKRRHHEHKEVRDAVWARPVVVIMSIIRSSRNPRLPQLQPLSARYNLIKKKRKKVWGYGLHSSPTATATATATTTTTTAVAAATTTPTTTHYHHHVLPPLAYRTGGVALAGRSMSRKCCHLSPHHRSLQSTPYMPCPGQLRLRSPR